MKGEMPDARISDDLRPWLDPRNNSIHDDRSRKTRPMIARCRESNHAADIDTGNNDIMCAGTLGSREHNIGQNRLSPVEGTPRDSPMPGKSIASTKNSEVKGSSTPS
jgi:hypothetical protein